MRAVLRSPQQQSRESSATTRTYAGWLTYVSALAASGQNQRARRAAAKLRKIDPGLDENRLRGILSQGVTSNTGFLDALIEIYRSVGLV